jgi:hypothetical protein
MMDWYDFDRLMMHCEFLASKERLPWFMSKALKRNGCWRTAEGKDEPYCSFDRFTYELSTDQVADISKTYRSMVSNQEKHRA